MFFGVSDLYQLQTNFYYSLNLVKRNKNINQNKNLLKVQKLFINGALKSNKNFSSEIFTIDFNPTLSFYLNSETISTQYNSIFFKNVNFSFEESYFGLINTQLKFPFQINLKNFDFEVSYYLNLPRSIGD